MPRSPEAFPENEEADSEDAEYHDESIIELPGDKSVVKSLKAKSEDYRSRIGKEKGESGEDASYKLAILQAVLEGGADRYVLESQLQLDKGGSFSQELFDNAWGVVSKYAAGRESEVRGGRGLKKIKD